MNVVASVQVILTDDGKIGFAPQPQDIGQKMFLVGLLEHGKAALLGHSVTADKPSVLVADRPLPNGHK